MSKSWWKRCFPTGVALARVFFWCSRRRPLLSFLDFISFTDRQEHLKDYIETSVMLQYNNIVGSVCTCITGVFLCFMVMFNVTIIENNRQLSSLFLE